MDWKRSETTKDGLIWAENVKKHVLRWQKWTSRNRLELVRNDESKLLIKIQTHIERAKMYLNPTLDHQKALKPSFNE